MPLIINFVGFQLLWLTCVVSAGMGLQWLGLLLACFVLAWHLYAATKRQLALQLLCYTACIGCLFDQLLYMFSLLQFSHWQATLIPPWMLMLWLGFASTLNVSLRWMQGKYWVGTIFGAIGGPLSYIAAEKLEAISILQTHAFLIALAIGWAVMMPILLWMAPKFDGFSPQLVPSRK